jgi:hypothetical protein
MRFATQLLNRQLLAGIAALSVGALAPTPGGAAPPGPAMLVCTNPYSGASWKISVDFAKGTVDSNPARIDDTKISWHDRTDGGNYTLERKSGKLTVIVASSTGGYFLYDHCKAD